jgi:addiction module RelE/StbE family toxin
MKKETYQVFWTQTAQQDLKKIVEYISADSSIQAKKVYLLLRQKAYNLQEMPLQGRYVPELSYHNIMTYRELIVTPWRIIYKIEQSNVWVLAVIDGRRNVEDILLDRFMPPYY